MLGKPRTEETITSNPFLMRVKAGFGAVGGMALLFLVLWIVVTGEYGWGCLFHLREAAHLFAVCPR